MAVQAVPTKGNLMATKKSLALAKNGFELLDKKRNILIREMMMLIDKASEIQDKIDSTYHKAYKALEVANITLGFCDEISKSVPEETSLKLSYRSVMGVEIPIVTIDENSNNGIYFSISNTNSSLDEAYLRFHEVKELTAVLAEVENSVYRLADAIKKTQKRANALKNVMIPKFEATVKFITEALEEKEREDYPNLREFLRSVVVPEMQIKLRQGFGRAIRTETDTCVVAVLDPRAARGRRYFQSMVEALPEMPVTGCLRAVEQFYRDRKGAGYFRLPNAG